MNILKNLVMVGLLTTRVVFCANYGGLVENPSADRESSVKTTLVAPALDNVGASRHTEKSNSSQRLKRGKGYTKGGNGCWILQPRQQPFAADRGAGIAPVVKARPDRYLSTPVLTAAAQWESVKPKRKIIPSNDNDREEAGHEDKRRKSALLSPVSSYLLVGKPLAPFGGPTTQEEKPKRVVTPYPTGFVPSFPAPVDAQTIAWRVFSSHASPTILNGKITRSARQ